MLPILRADGFLGDDTLHPYHCDCDNCTGDTYPLRAQTDSSCNGELITDVRLGWDASDYEIMQAIQGAAIRADATPGYNAGFHVHVQSSHIRAVTKSEILWQWLKWEPVMASLARGCFGEMRRFNHSLQRNMDYHLVHSYQASNASWYRMDGRWESVPEYLDWYEQHLDPDELKEYKRDLLAVAQDQDRHSYLATRTRYDTFEFRLWNSTRSAWRMEMFVGLSKAWMDPNFVRILRDEATVYDLDVLPQLLAQAGYDTEAELVCKQTYYMNSRQGQDDLALTA